MSAKWWPAKLSPPQARNVWHRTRLFEELDGALSASAILWIAASSGAGKTTLVASYLQQRNLPTLWYRIDEGDRDPAAFLHHLALLASWIAPGGGGTTLPRFPAESPAGLTVFARGYFNHFFRGLRRGAVLVFDDWVLPPESSVFELVRVALNNLPDGINVIVISRDGPPAAYARVRANGSMTVMDGNLLRLTADEAAALAEVRCDAGSIPTSGTISDLHELVDGWVVGFLLILDGLRNSGMSLGQSALPNERVLFDYLTGEVLEQLDRDDRDFLLRVAILPVVTPESAEAVTDNSEAATVLERLNRRCGSFVRASWAPRLTYTFSPVFRRFLLAKGRERIAREEQSELTHKAARWLSGTGRVEEAVELLAGGAEWPALGALISKEAPRRLAQGGHGAVLGWLHQVPPGVLEQDPNLCYWLGAARIPTDLVESRRWFERAYALFCDRQDRTGTLLSWAAIVETIFFEWGDFSKLRDWIADGEKLLNEDIELPAGEVGRRVVSAMFNALMHGQPDHPRIGAWARRLCELLCQVEDDSERLLMGATLFIYYTKWLGEHVRAEIVLEMLCPPPERLSQLTPMARIMLAMLKCTYHWNRYDLAAADSAIQDGIESAERTGIHVWDFLLNAQPVYAGLSMGDLAQADRYLNRLRELLPRRAPLDQAHYHYLAGWQAMLLDDPNRALEHMRHAESLIDEAKGPMQYALNCIAMAQVRHALGENHEIPPLLAHARRMAEGVKSPLLAFMIVYTEAWLALDAGDDSACRAALSEALKLAHKHDYLNFSWCHPSVLARLCIKALEANIETTFVRRLIRIRRIVPDAPPVHLEHWPWDLKVYTLGRFSLVKDDAALCFNGKAQRRSLQMLKALIAMGGREVPEICISEALWPEAEGDHAHSSFTTTLSRLRKLVGGHSLYFRGGCLSLDARRCWVDAWAFQRILGEAQNAPSEDEAEALAYQAMDLYHGPFLGSEEDAPWLRLPRERLRKRLVEVVIARAQRLETAGRSKRSLVLFGKVLAADPDTQELFDHKDAL